jgi:photosystem II stability/assembly factor-like uncharacterized protein
MASFIMRQIGASSVLIAIIAIALSATLCAGVNEWTSLGPEGGRVPRLVADPQAPSTVYAGTCGGVFKTADGGASWTAVNSGLSVPGCVGLLVIDPRNASTVYAGASCGIYKTTDAGASWSAINSGLNLPANCVVSLAISSSTPGTLYAGGNGVFKTTDAGSSWNEVDHSVLRTGNAIALLTLDAQNEDTIYAAGFLGLLKSSDGGASWNRADSGLPVTIDALAVDPRASGTLYAGRRDRIFKSTDGGISWRDASLGLRPAPPPSLGYGQVLTLSINPQTPAVIYALSSQHSNGSPDSFFLATSTDGGASWTTATDPILASNDLNAIALDSQQPGTLYIGTNQGVLKSTDGGGHWNTANSGLETTAIQQVVIDSQHGTIFAVNGTERLLHGTRVFKSTDYGMSWSPSDFGLPLYLGGLVAQPQDPRTLYILGAHSPYGTGLFKSEDAGESWSEIWTNTMPATGVGPLAINPQNPNVMYAGVTTCTGNCFARIVKSIDGGRTFTESQVSLKGSGCCSSIVNVAVDPQNTDIIYAGTADFDGSGSGLWKSTDAGLSWVNLYGGDIDAIAIDSRNSGTVYFSEDGSVYKSTDAGQTWMIAKSRAAGCCGPTPMLIDPQNSDILYYAGYDKGAGKRTIFKSTDAGASWTSVGPGLRGFVNSLAIDARNPATVYAGTSSGLFAITFDSQQK